MKKHRAQSDNAMLEMLRSRGAVIGPTAGEALQAAVAKLDAHATHNGERRDAETLPRGAVPAAAPRSSIRRFKSQTERRFAAHLDSLAAQGKILRWRYEAERLQLADHGQPAVTYTPDFVAWLAGGRRIFFEVKSRFHRDSDTETRKSSCGRVSSLPTRPMNSTPIARSTASPARSAKCGAKIS